MAHAYGAQTVQTAVHSAPLAVVDQRFCLNQPTILKLREKILSFSGDDLAIADTLGRPWFKCKGKVLSLRDRKKLFDVHGQEIAEMREPLGFIHKKMDVSGPGYKFQIRSKFTFFSSKAEAAVTNRATGQSQILYSKGNWLDKNVTIYLGDPKAGGHVIATIARSFGFGELASAQTYYLQVAPNVDVALCVIMCICFDEFNNEGG